MELCVVPWCFKCSTIIPIPKKPKITDLKDYRLGMRGKKGTGKIPVYIIFETVRYHNFAQFGISHAAVLKCTCRCQCFPNSCATGKCDNRAIRWIKLNETLSTHPKLINKENSHYSAYKIDDKGEWTYLSAPVCKCCCKSCAATEGNTSNLFKHLSLVHNDLFRELRYWLHQWVSASFINSFIYNWSTHIQMWNSKLKFACGTC